jgi:hypothetical protein
MTTDIFDGGNPVYPDIAVNSDGSSNDMTDPTSGQPNVSTPNSPIPLEGWPGNGIPIFSDFNKLFRMITQWIRWLYDHLINTTDVAISTIGGSVSTLQSEVEDTYTGLLTRAANLESEDEKTTIVTGSFIIPDLSIEQTIEITNINLLTHALKSFRLSASHLTGYVSAIQVPFCKAGTKYAYLFTQVEGGPVTKTYITINLAIAETNKTLTYNAVLYENAFAGG